jgi:hypothetical protein
MKRIVFKKTYEIIVLLYQKTKKILFLKIVDNWLGNSGSIIEYKVFFTIQLNKFNIIFKNIASTFTRKKKTSSNIYKRIVRDFFVMFLKKCHNFNLYLLHKRLFYPYNTIDVQKTPHSNLYMWQMTNTITNLNLSYLALAELVVNKHPKSIKLISIPKRQQTIISLTCY